MSNQFSHMASYFLACPQTWNTLGQTQIAQELLHSNPKHLVLCFQEKQPKTFLALVFSNPFLLGTPSTQTSKF